jgi:hypothetical protein
VVSGQTVVCIWMCVCVRVIWLTWTTCFSPDQCYVWMYPCLWNGSTYATGCSANLGYVSGTEHMPCGGNCRCVLCRCHASINKQFICILQLLSSWDLFQAYGQWKHGLLYYYIRYYDIKGQFVVSISARRTNSTYSNYLDLLYLFTKSCYFYEWILANNTHSNIMHQKSIYHWLHSHFR